MATICFDVDGVVAKGGHPYWACEVIPEGVERVRRAKADGHTIYFLTARYMAMYYNDQIKAIKAGYQELKEWLDRNNIPYDGIFLGKPGANLYPDDNGCRAEAMAGESGLKELDSHLERLRGK
jgi:hypothetical protein